MLVEFSVKNFRSIKEKVTLSLAASSEDTHIQNTFLDPSGKIRLLKTIAIYGANASGKSNIIKALELMRQIVLKSHELQRGDKLGVVPFKLDSESLQHPTEFEIVFIKDGMRYVYGFSADEDRIYEEWLTEADLGKVRIVPRILFQRERKADNTYEYNLGECWRPRNVRLTQNTMENTLFLVKSVQDNHRKASEVFDWFRDRLKNMSGEPEETTEMAFTMELCEKDSDIKTRVRQMLRDADLGIMDFSCIREPLIGSSGWQEMSELIRKKILDDLGSDIDKAILHQVKTKHSMVDTVATVDFDLKIDESRGTQRFFSLSGPVMHSMINDNIIFCDELDSSLHPMLTRALIDMIHENSKTRFQFIFTTHDCALLDAEIFRRDQVWFTEKNKSMATDLYSLWDIKPRAEENFRKGYLSGRYGAIPFLGEFNFE